MEGRADGHHDYYYPILLLLFLLTKLHQGRTTDKHRDSSNKTTTTTVMIDEADIKRATFGSTRKGGKKDVINGPTKIMVGETPPLLPLLHLLLLEEDTVL